MCIKCITKMKKNMEKLIKKIQKDFVTEIKHDTFLNKKCVYIIFDNFRIVLVESNSRSFSCTIYKNKKEIIHLYWFKKPKKLYSLIKQLLKWGEEQDIYAKSALKVWVKMIEEKIALFLEWNKTKMAIEVEIRKKN